MTLREETIEKLAAAQTTIYEMVGKLEKAESRIALMAIHRNIGDAVYDLMTNADLEEAA